MRRTLSAILASLTLTGAAVFGAGPLLQDQAAQAQTADQTVTQIAAAALPTLGAPAGKVLLTVTGPVAVTNAPGAARFDDAMLAALPRSGFATSTIWTEGVARFEGVELRALLDRLGIAAGTLKITAINDYSVQIPVAEIAPGGALLADRRNGKPMSVRDKGPLWVVYPYDSASDFRNEVIYSRSVWQVDRIEVLP